MFVSLHGESGPLKCHLHLQSYMFYRFYLCFLYVNMKANIIRKIRISEIFCFPPQVQGTLI